jgi:peptidoglycan/xylan/chitin deacetylase (PgdA/CDA1 family)
MPSEPSVVLSPEQPDSPNETMAIAASPYEDTRILVLMYHAFDRGKEPLTVDGWQFERQLLWLRDNGIAIVPTSALAMFLRKEKPLPKRAAVITIDDGDKSVHAVAWPILKKLEVPFTLALPTKLMNENKKHRMLTWDQVREMVDSGLCEVASHGHEHKSIVHFSNEQAVRQLETSRDILEKETGQRPIAFVYPLGAFDARTSALVEKVGYSMAFKASGAPIGMDCCDPYALPRMGIVHQDTVWSLGWYFSPSFLGRMTRLPRGR